MFTFLNSIVFKEPSGFFSPSNLYSHVSSLFIYLSIHRSLLLFFFYFAFFALRGIPFYAIDLFILFSRGSCLFSLSAAVIVIKEITLSSLFDTQSIITFIFLFFCSRFRLFFTCYFSINKRCCRFKK